MPIMLMRLGRRDLFYNCNVFTVACFGGLAAWSLDQACMPTVFQQCCIAFAK